jgi:hypothetical protein
MQCMKRPELLLLLALRILLLCVVLFAASHELCLALPRLINLAAASHKLERRPLPLALRLVGWAGG